jgi:hypothetical protein
MEVATDIYTKGERAIAIIGVCHIAEESFWTGIKKRLDGYEAMGYSVQYERVRNDLKDDGTEKPRGTGKLYDMLADASGLVAQSHALEYKEHWRNTDLTLSQMMEYSYMASLTSMIEQATDTLEKLVSLGGKERLGRDIRIGLRWMPVARHFIPKNRDRDAIVINLRNIIAADAMLNAEGNVVSIWGAGHLKGIGELLREEGFVRESRLWTPVISKVAAA